MPQRNQCNRRLLRLFRELISECVYNFDVTKLSVHTLDIGLAGIEVYDILRDEYDIQIEFGDLGNILAYISIGDRQRDLERLVAALAEIRRKYQRDKAGLMNQEYIDPRWRLLPAGLLCREGKPAFAGDFGPGEQ